MNKLQAEFEKETGRECSSSVDVNDTVLLYDSAEYVKWLEQKLLTAESYKEGSKTQRLKMGFYCQYNKYTY